MKNHFLRGLFFAALVCMLGFVTWRASVVRAPMLTVAFLDIGQGDAIFIETPSGRQVLIDGGPDRKVLAELNEQMSFRDHAIDIVINTHPDKDHIGGLPDVLEYYDASVVLDPGVASESGIYKAYRDRITAKGIQYIEARRGERISFGDGVYIDILFPDRDMDGVSDDNNASIVARVVYGEIAVMLTGDAPKSVESRLAMLDGGELRSNILKAGHHGSKTSSLPGFVSLVSPDYAVISAGRDNSYGHPHKEALAAFTAASATVLATYELGPVVFKSDGRTISLQE